ncbi:hypothetical protein F4810DRAFT_548054 [Camillea tinctor]|nr:hypothetical protein F4810DRAFT_548054 [Camillea tinctor]
MGDRLDRYPTRRSLPSMKPATPRTSRTPNDRKRQQSKTPQTTKPKKPKLKGGWHSVRDILDEKVEANGVIRYLIDWDGTDSKGKPWDPTWEPAENVTEAAIQAWKDKKDKKVKVASASAEGSSPYSSPATEESSSEDSQPVRVPARGSRNSKRGADKTRSKEDRPTQAPGPHEKREEREREQKRRRTGEPPQRQLRSANPNLRLGGSAGRQGAKPDPKSQSPKNPNATSEVRGNTIIKGGRIVIELPHNANFNPSEFDVVSLSQSTSQGSSQSSVVRRYRQFSQLSQQVNARANDQRVIPDSQEISTLSASEPHNSPLDHPGFAVSQSTIHSQTTNRASQDAAFKIPAAARSASEIPSHQPDPFAVNNSGNWGVSTFLTDSRTTTTTNRLNQSYIRQSTNTRPSQPTPSGRDVVFQTQVSFASDTEPGASQQTQVSNRGASDLPVGQQPSSQNSLHSLSAHSVSSQGTALQAAQIVAPPVDSQPHDLSSQSQENFTVYDEVSNIPNIALRQTQPTQNSQDSSQALSELDGNTRTSSASQDPAARPQIALAPNERIHPHETRSGDLPAGPRPSPRNTPAGQPTTPAKMDSAPAGDASLSARDRLKLLREQHFGDSEPFGDPLAHDEIPPSDDVSHDPLPEVNQHPDSMLATSPVPAAGDLAPLVSPTFVVPSLEPPHSSQLPHDPPSTFDEPQAPVEQAHPSDLVLGPNSSQLPFHGSHEEQLATLNPSQLTLSIEGDMDVSPSLQTDDGNDGIGSGYPASDAPDHEDVEMPSDYPKSLLPYVPTGPNEYLVTLPFHANIRPQYNDILRENEALMDKYNTSFRVSPHQVPDATTTLKVDEMFSRLFNICDFPPFPEAVTSMSPDQVTKHIIGTNAKFAFVAEFLDILTKELHSDRKILILVRPGQLMDLLGYVIESRGCTYIRCGNLITDSSSYNVTVMVSSTEAPPSSIPRDVDAVIAFDHTFRQGMLPSFDKAFPPKILALTNTASIQHLNMRIVDNLAPLERKNVLILALIKAMRSVEEPERCVKLTDSASLFAKYIHFRDEDDNFHWEPQELPDEIFEDLYAASSQAQLSQSSLQAYGADQLLENRKRSLMEDDDDVLHKRLKMSQMSQMSQPQVVTDTSQISDSLKSLIQDDPSKEAGKATVTISIGKLEELTNQIANLQAKLDESHHRESQFRELSDRSKKEVDSYTSSIWAIQVKYMEALKDRGVFDADCQKAKEETKNLTKRLESSQAENVALKQKNAELEKKLSEATEALLNSSNPDLVKLASQEKELEKAKAKAQQLEKQVAIVQNDMEFTKNQYQTASQRAMELSAENRGLEQQIAKLRQRADANIVEVNRIQSRREVKELTRMLQEQRTIVREREAELNHVRDELRIRSSRRETRQSSVPRSPRLSALSVMSPRNGSVRIPSAMGGGSSRGGSPAYDSGSGGPGGYAGGGTGVAGSMAQNAPLFNQPAGSNHRYSHLRDGRFQ